jgi:Uma2 family endonuclease
MTIAVRHTPMTLAVFLDWVDGQRERYELKEGAPRMMVRVSMNHARTVSRFLRLVASRLDQAGFETVASDFGVAIGEDMRFPDIVALPRGTPGKALLTREPALIIEVLSPSSLHIDMREKAEEYLSLPSLHAYVVASQDEPRVWVWLRGEDGNFPKQPEPVAGADKVVEVKPLGLSLPLAEVYARIGP